ncbi:MAG: hypothetical protein ABEH43_11595 [Flavobacteriales bacterium]
MFRVDQRDFAICDIIEPPKIPYQESEEFGDDKQKLEDILSEELPDNKSGADRKSGLYIFAELSDAIRFCYRMSNSKIYKLEPLEDTTCYHRGDMNWTEIMNEFLNNENTLRQMARLYWEGRKTFKPCWEMLVNKIKVTNIIVGDNSRSDLCRAYQTANGNVEQMDIYTETLNQIRQQE